MQGSIRTMAKREHCSQPNSVRPNGHALPHPMNTRPINPRVGPAIAGGENIGPVAVRAADAGSGASFREVAHFPDAICRRGWLHRTSAARRALARAEVPSLKNVRVTASGRLEGVTEFITDAGTDVQAATAITEHLLELLVNFVGEPLTLRLLRDAWPDESLEE